MKNGLMCKNCGEIIDLAKPESIKVHIIREEDSMTIRCWRCHICGQLYLTKKQAALAGQAMLLLGYDVDEIGRKRGEPDSDEAKETELIDNVEDSKE